MSWLAPSASPISLRASSAQTWVSPLPKSTADGTAPEAAEASTTTVSFVDMQPSESARSKVTRVASRSTTSSISGGTSASVVRTTSMVASPGASMPAPLAMPPMVNSLPSASVPVKTACLGTESVVMIAVAASGPPSVLSAAVAAPIPARILSIGSCSPIRPVEQTKTSVAEAPSASAVFSAVVCVFWKPCGPVQALAPPEFRMTASTRPSLMTSRDQCTGAAATRLEVNTAAAAFPGPSLTTRARSGLPEVLRPAVTPAARNPWGTVMLMVRLPADRGRRFPPGRGQCSWTARLRRRSPWSGCRWRT